ESEDAQAGQQIPDDAGPGFLDNPDVLNNLERETAEQNDALPMPAPISNEADDLGMDQTSLLAGAQPNPVLTPMPSVEDGVQFEPSQQVPRGPDSGAASAESAAPSGTTALDMIRQAQQQRENR